MLPLILLTGCQLDLSLDRLDKSLIDAVQVASSGIVTVVVTLETEDDSVATDRTGSGVIIDSDGTIITTHGVVDGGESFRVLFQDGCQYSGRVVGVDRETNIALLTTDEHSHGCFPVPMDEAEDIDVGSIGLVLGNSSISRGISVGWGVLSHSWLGGDDSYCDPLHILQGSNLFTQTGSGVVNVKGDLIGICDNKISGFDGAWAVIPTSTLKRVSKLLQADQSISRGWLGVCIDNPYKNPTNGESKGVKIAQVIDNSPASKLGIQIGETILTAGNTPIKDVNSLRRKITGTQPDQSISLTILSSESAERTIDVLLARLTDNPDRSCRCRGRSL